MEGFIPIIPPSEKSRKNVGKVRKKLENVRNYFGTFLGNLQFGADGDGCELKGNLVADRTLGGEGGIEIGLNRPK